MTKTPGYFKSRNILISKFVQTQNTESVKFLTVHLGPNYMAIDCHCICGLNHKLENLQLVFDITSSPVSDLRTIQLDNLIIWWGQTIKIKLAIWATILRKWVFTLMKSFIFGKFCKHNSHKRASPDEAGLAKICLIAK